MAGSLEEGSCGVQGGSFLNRLSPSEHFHPLNLEESSAPVPGNRPAGANGAHKSLGRASSSRKCVILSLVAVVLTICLAVGLGVGLSKGGDSGSPQGDAVAVPSPTPAPSPSPPAESPPPAAGGTYTLMGADGAEAQLSPACAQVAKSPGLLNVSSYSLTFNLTAPMFMATEAVASFGAAAVLTVVPEALAADGATPYDGPACVVLNARGLNFSSVAVQATAKGGQPGGAVQLCSDAAACAPGGVVVSAPFKRLTAGQLASTADDNLIAFALNGTALEPGYAANLSFAYTGVLGSWPSDDMSLGLYRSKPFPPSNTTSDVLETLVVSHGAQIGARRIFPCDDRPIAKATFQLVNTVTPASKELLSNGVCTSDLSFALKARLWNCTAVPKMSPYLFALAAGDISQHQPAQGGTRRRLQAAPTPTPAPAAPTPAEKATRVAAWEPNVRVYTVGREQTKDQLAVAYTTAAAALKFYANRLGIRLDDHGVNKFDLLAVPGKAGAMENWGLLLFDERRFLNAREGGYELYLAVDVICHEIAHQWVGNLATKKDWTMVSVDEGISSFLEYKCIEHLGELASTDVNSISTEAPDRAFKLQAIQRMKDSGLGLQRLRYTGEALFARSSAPQLQIPGYHEAPAQAALFFAGDPTQPAIVPPTDLDLNVGSNIGGFAHYAKPASLMRMYERFLNETGGDDTLIPILGQFVASFAGKGWTWGDFYYVVHQLTLAAVDAAKNEADKNSKQRLADLVAWRAQSFWEAETYSDIVNRVIGVEAFDHTLEDGSTQAGRPTMATWFYTPTYPIFSFANGARVNPTNYNKTVFDFGSTSRPFCAFRPALALDNFDSVPGVVDIKNKACWLCEYNPASSEDEGAQKQKCGGGDGNMVKSGQRYYVSTLAFDQIMAEAPPGTSEGNYSSTAYPEHWAEAANSKNWVGNQFGAKLFRSAYNTTHFSDLVAELGAMRNICNNGPVENATAAVPQPCTRLSDLLEGATLLGDATTLALSDPIYTTGLDPAVDSTQVATSLSEVLRAVKIVLEGSDPAQPPDWSSGHWQHLVGGAASDALFNLKRLFDYDKVDSTCRANYSRFMLRALNGTVAAVADQWLPDGTHSDLLAEMAGPRLLWQHSMIDSSGSVADSLCAALTLTPLWSAQLAPALNASAGWDVAEVGFDPIEPSGSLTPAVYTVAAALPPACVDVLDRGAKNRTAALAPNALPALVASALQRCYWQSESQTNALRCLYSLPALAYAFDGDTPQASGAGSADHPAVVAANATLSWLFDLSADSLSQVCANRSVTAAAKVRCYARHADLPRHLPALVTNLARPSAPHLDAVLTFMKEHWTAAAAATAGNLKILATAGSPTDAGTLSAQLMCGIVEAMPVPVTNANRDAMTALLEFLTSSGAGGAPGCLPATFVRASGRAEQQRAALERMLVSEFETVCTETINA